MRTLKAFALAFILACYSFGAESGSLPSGVNDPFGLGERLALIDHLQGRGVSYEAGATLEQLRTAYNKFNQQHNQEGLRPKLLARLADEYGIKLGTQKLSDDELAEALKSLELRFKTLVERKMAVLQSELADADKVILESKQKSLEVNARLSDIAAKLSAAEKKLAEAEVNSQALARQLNEALSRPQPGDAKPDPLPKPQESPSLPKHTVVSAQIGLRDRERAIYIHCESRPTKEQSNSLLKLYRDRATAKGQVVVKILEDGDWWPVAVDNMDGTPIIYPNF